MRGFFPSKVPKDRIEKVNKLLTMGLPLNVPGLNLNDIADISFELVKTIVITSRLPRQTSVEV